MTSQAQASIIPDYDAPFYYEFLLDGTVPKEGKATVMTLYDRKIAAAKNFLKYLNSIDNGQNDYQSDVRNPQYLQVQSELSQPIVDGKVFTKLNEDYNHTTYEVEDTRKAKKRITEESSSCTALSNTSKKNFNDAVKSLEAKSQQINYTNIGNISYIKEDALRFHFEKICAWILDIYYDTPASKYEWDNFKQQVFLSDKGADLQKRIKGLYVPKLYDYQIETCQYILKTKDLFKAKLGNNDLEVLLSTAADVIAAYNARQEYTNSKKTLAFNRSKDIEYTIDLGQSEKVSKTTHPFIDTIYDRLIRKEMDYRFNNLSDFVGDNRSEHFFFKGKEGRITSFMRGDSLSTYGKPQTDDPTKKPIGKAEKKSEVKPVDVKDIRLAETTAQQPILVTKQPVKIGNADIEFDDSFEMGKVE